MDFFVIFSDQLFGLVAGKYFSSVLQAQLGQALARFFLVIVLSLYLPTQPSINNK